MFEILLWDAENLWTEIGKVSGTEAAYEAYIKACEFAEMVGKDCALMDAETGEIIAEMNEEDY